MKENQCKKCKNRKSEKLSKVSRVPAGSSQKRSGGLRSPAGVPRAFDTFRNSKQYMGAACDPNDGNIDFADLDPEGTLEGRNSLGGIIGDSRAFHLRCLGSPARSWNSHLEIRDCSGAFGRSILSNPRKKRVSFCMNLDSNIFKRNSFDRR